MKMQRVGIIGLGVGERHFRAFKRHPGCKVVALCDFLEEKIRSVRSGDTDIRVGTDAAEILDAPDVDIVSIASYDQDHFHQVSAALKNGKHVFVEKPLCLYEKESAAIQACLVENPGLRLSCNLVLRTCPRFIKIRKAIQDGELGDVYYIEGDYLWGRINKLVDGWRTGMDFYSIIYGAAIHLIDLVVWLTGRKPIVVQACGNRLGTRNSPMQHNSFAVIMMQFEDGLIAKITGNGACVHPHFHGLKVFGSRKTLIHDTTGARWIESRSPEDTPVEVQEAYPAKEARDEVVISFVDSILNDTPPLVSSNEVFDLMAVCFAAQKAMTDMSPVTIQYH